MKRLVFRLLAITTIIIAPLSIKAQEESSALRQAQGPQALQLTLDQTLEIALSENTSVKVADMEIQRLKYARKGTYAALFPQVNGSGSYQRTIKRQVMYMGGGDDSGSGGGTSSMFAGILFSSIWPVLE